MNSPYMGDFRVSQCQTPDHDGLDLVGIDSKEIHSTAAGIVIFAGWENPNDHTQGFGQYVCIKSDDDGLYYYYGHLSEVRVQYGTKVHITDVIGIEGSTGHSTGSHCHYCIRPKYAAGEALSTPIISGIPNEIGVYNDGYVVTKTERGYVNVTYPHQIKISCTIDDHEYSGLITEV